MSSAFGKILGIFLFLALALMLWRLLLAVYRSLRREPISGPGALGKAIGFAAVGGPFVEMCVAIFAASFSDTYDSSVVFFGTVLVVVVTSSYVSGYLAAHTYEPTQLMNGWLNAVLGGIGRVPALLLLGALRSSTLSWLALCLFVPFAIGGALHRVRLGRGASPASGIEQVPNPQLNTDAPPSGGAPVS